MQFTKMQALGNDYLYVKANQMPENAAELSRRLSDRHHGPGADGMIWILPSEQGDFAMRAFNADGSEAKVCGNGIRCVGKYVYDKGLTDKTRITIETPAGLRTLTLAFEGDQVVGAAVEMGTVQVFNSHRLVAGGKIVSARPVDVGNSHAVVFRDWVIPQEELTTLGPALERHAAFPGGANVEFVTVVNPNKLRMRAWERGSGVTLACGTGACAAAAAAVATRRSPFGEPITLELDGGALTVIVREDWSVLMEGPAYTVYEGEVQP